MAHKHICVHVFTLTYTCTYTYAYAGTYTYMHIYRILEKAIAANLVINVAFVEQILSVAGMYDCIHACGDIYAYRD